MSSENYVNLTYDDEKIRLTVLTNICRMLVTRGYMDAKKYGVFTDKIGLEEKSRVDQVSRIDHINNYLFLPFIETRVDNNVYIIPLDTKYDEQKESKDKDKDNNFNGDSVIVKIIPQVVKDITNSAMLNDFFKTYNSYHSIIVFDGMADKVYSILSKKKNIEVFARDYFMIDLMSHDCAPISCNFVTGDELNYMKNAKIAKIHENDPLVRYYNGKKGNIIRIVRPSLNNSAESACRRVIEPKLVFK